MFSSYEFKEERGGGEGRRGLRKGEGYGIYMGGGIFCQKNLIIKLCKGRVISVRTGLFFFRKFHNPPRVNWCAPYFGTFKKN